MKFLFCGGLAIPEWFLSQLNLLSNLTFVKLRKVSTLYITSLTDNDQSSLEQILEILLSSDFQETEAKTIIAMLDFIITNSAKNDISSEDLMKELIDLGIPKENCQSLSKVIEQNQEKLRSSFRDKVLRQSRFQDISITKSRLLKSSESSKSVNEQFFTVSITHESPLLAGKSPVCSFVVDSNNLQRLQEDLAGIMKILAKRS